VGQAGEQAARLGDQLKADYVSVYRRIIPPNLDRWVVFRHGTAYVLEESNPAESAADIEREALAFLKEHGPVLVGSSAADFNPVPLKDGLGWLVCFSPDGMFNVLLPAECPVPPDPLRIGLTGRGKRERDAAELEVIHVQVRGGAPAVRKGLIARLRERLGI
jgi:hypothetical protein